MEEQRDKKKLGKYFTPLRMKIGAGIAAGILVCTGGYFAIHHFVRPADHHKGAGSVTTAPATSQRKTAAPTVKITASPVTLEPEQSKEFQALTSLRRANGSVLTYQYDGNTITAKDEDGDIALQIIINEDGMVAEKQSHRGRMIESFAYDADGNLIKKMILKYGTDGAPDHYYICEYNASGIITKRSLYYDEILADALVAVSEFDENGTLLRTRMEHEESDRGSSYSYTLNDAGLLASVQSIEYSDNEKSSICCADEYFYDSNGNIREENALYRMGWQPHAVRKYVYDENHTELESMYVMPKTERVIQVTGDFASDWEWCYEFLREKEGGVIPALIFGKGDGGTFSWEPLNAAHTPSASCEPKYDSEGRLVRCVHDRDDDWYWTESEFDQNGRKIKEIHHIFSSGYTTSTYEYDDKGNLAAIKASSGDYLYDSEGRVCRFQYSRYGNLLCMDFIFDENGKAYMKKCSFQSENKEFPLRGVEYFYDESYHLSKTVYECMETNGYSMQEYNAEGRKLQETLYTNDSTFVVRREFLYNKLGWLVRCNQYRENGKLRSWTIYTLDGAGEVVDWETYTENGKISSKYVYQYDAAGVPLSQKVYKEDGSLFCEYRYDRNGCVNHYKNYATDWDAIEANFTYVTDAEYQLYTRCNFEDLIVTLLLKK